MNSTTVIVCEQTSVFWLSCICVLYLECSTGLGHKDRSVMFGAPDEETSAMPSYPIADTQALIQRLIGEIVLDHLQSQTTTF